MSGSKFLKVANNSLLRELLLFNLFNLFILLISLSLNKQILCPFLMKPLLILKQWFQYNVLSVFGQNLKYVVFSQIMTSIKKSVFYIFFYSFLSSIHFSRYIKSRKKIQYLRKITISSKSLSIMEISTLLNIKNQKYFYDFSIKSKNIVEFINQINGKVRLTV